MRTNILLHQGKSAYKEKEIEIVPIDTCRNCRYKDFCVTEANEDGEEWDDDCCCTLWEAKGE